MCLHDKGDLFVLVFEVGKQMFKMQQTVVKLVIHPRLIVLSYYTRVAIMPYLPGKCLVFEDLPGKLPGFCICLVFAWF